MRAFWKASPVKENRALCLVILALTGLCIYQQVLITDLQERMMNIEASRYDDQLNDIRWEAEQALEENKEQYRDIYHLMKHSSDQGFRLSQLEWDRYGDGE